jgi:protein SCO1/2
MRIGCVLFIWICVVGCQQNIGQLPVFNPADVDPRLVDQRLRNQKENHTIADFKLLNQNGQTITQEDYRDKIYVADFIFTRCPSICPLMTNNMAKVQEAYRYDDRVKLLSLSVTPEIDSVPVLKEYAARNGVIDAKWNIVTGNKSHIYELARKSFFAVVEEGDGGLQDFIHTEKLILVDKERRIRGFYNGTDDREVKKLISDIKKLE